MTSFSDLYPEESYQPTKKDYWYNKYHFSGAEVRVYMSLIGYIENIMSIQYGLTNTKAPLYGYASTYFDMICPGTVIVSGALILALQYTDYLSVAWTQIEDFYKHTNISLDSNLAEGITGGSQGYSETVAQVTGAKPKDIPINKNRRDYNLDHRIFENEKLGDKDEQKDHSVWTSVPGIVKKKKVPRLDMKEMYIPAIIFKNNKMLRAKSTVIGPGCDLYVQFGYPGKDRTFIADKNYGFNVLNDVHFTGRQGIVGPTGDVIAEQVDFIALSLDKKIPGAVNLDYGFKVYHDRITETTMYNQAIPIEQ